MNNELNEMIPCPFCGNEAVVKESWLNGVYHIADKRFAVGCGNKNGCPASNNEQDEQGGFACSFPTIEEAIVNWNARVIENKLRARIAELEATQRWIPVGEKPLEAGTFLVLLKDGDIKTDWTFLDGGRYYWWNSGDAVTHWMPRPKLPKERDR